MTGKIDELMERLRAGLAGLPSDTVNRALDYYREYIAEALEAGRSEEDILKRLGAPEEIAAQVRAEASVSRAEKTPGPFRLIGAGKNVLGAAASTAARASLAIGASVPFTLTLGLYTFSVGAFIGALGAVALMAYGIAQTASGYIWEKVGQGGAALLAAALLTALGLGLWLAAKGLARFTLRILRRGLRRDHGPSIAPAGMMRSTNRVRQAFLACAAGGVLGLLLLAPSGLAPRYFSIWNSMKPPHSSIRTWTYRSGEVQALEIVTMNSQIVVKSAEGQSETISVSYEEPDWMSGESALKGHRLIFAEASRNRLPFMGFISRHEGTTAVTVEVPRGFQAEAAAFASNGGHISIALRSKVVSAKTYSGTIRFSDGGNLYSIRASSRNGVITVKGSPLDGNAYSVSRTAGYRAELASTDGNIGIK